MVEEGHPSFLRSKLRETDVRRVVPPLASDLSVEQRWKGRSLQVRGQPEGDDRCFYRGCFFSATCLDLELQSGRSQNPCSREMILSTNPPSPHFTLPSLTMT